MIDQSIKVIQIGGLPLFLDEWLQYFFVETKDVGDFSIDNIPLISNGRVNPKFNDFRFLLTADSDFLLDLNNILMLPANNIIIDKKFEISESYKKKLKLLNAQYLEFDDHEQLARNLITNFFQGQKGYLFKLNDFIVSPQLSANTEQVGNTKLTFSDLNDGSLQYLGSYTVNYFASAGEQWEFIPQCNVEGDETELEYHIRLAEPQSGNIWNHIINNSQLHEITVLPPFENDTNMTINVYGRGKGKISINDFQIMKSHNGHGYAMIGGENKILDKDMNQQILFYFNAGDLKPPLNVYFSGFRNKSGFEGYFMMSRLNAPFILVRDPRLDGGDFYIGSPNLEKAIIQYIKDKLNLLDFNEQELVLSGLSMGSFGALYYAADFRAKAVIIGKPLINLGTIALNKRINRPERFDTAADMLLTWFGSAGETEVERADQVFRNKFKHGKFEQTEFNIIYMKEDDLDLMAFSELNKYLRGKYPQIKIIHKGLIGRHNDDFAGSTPRVSDLLIRQFERFLSSNYDRKYGEIDND